MTAGQRSDRGVTPTRASRAWLGVAIGIFVLVVVLVFILQNLQSVRINFFAASGSFPLAVGLLFAAVLGGFSVLLIGTARILQLRRRVRLGEKSPSERSDVETGQGVEPDRVPVERNGAAHLAKRR